MMQSALVKSIIAVRGSRSFAAMFTRTNTGIQSGQKLIRNRPLNKSNNMRVDRDCGLKFYSAKTSHAIRLPSTLSLSRSAAPSPAIVILECRCPFSF